MLGAKRTFKKKDTVICTNSEIGQEQKVGRVLNRSVNAISCSSATSLPHITFFSAFFPLTHYLQLLANTLQSSFSSSTSMASIHIKLF